jgi:subtilisin family serine protease
VAILDTGIDLSHPAFAGLQVEQRDFAGEADGDGHGHGTHVAATVFGRDVLAIVDEHEVTVVALDTGEILSTHRIELDKGYWRNTRRDPGRWPGSRATC